MQYTQNTIKYDHDQVTNAVEVISEFSFKNGVKFYKHNIKIESFLLW